MGKIQPFDFGAKSIPRARNRIEFPRALNLRLLMQILTLGGGAVFMRLLFVT